MKKVLLSSIIALLSSSFAYSAAYDCKTILPQGKSVVPGYVNLRVLWGGDISGFNMDSKEPGFSFNLHTIGAVESVFEQGNQTIVTLKTLAYFQMTQDIPEFSNNAHSTVYDLIIDNATGKLSLSSPNNAAINSTGECRRMW